MTTETIQLPVVRFRTPAGAPTCAIGPDAETTCRFMGMRRGGLQPVCLIDAKDLYRGSGGSGYIIPSDDCLVWKTA